MDSQLPAWYTRVAYVQWTAGRARFNTNVAWWSDDLVFEAKVKYTTYAQYWYFWWNYNGSETANTTRLILGSSAWGVLWGINYKANWGNASSSSFSVNARHTVKIYKENWASKLNLNGAITTSSVSQWTANNTMIAFNANRTSSTASQSSVNQFEYLRIYDKWILIRNYVPCKNSNGVYWMYDLVNGTWNPSVWSNQFTWWPEVTWRWVYKYWATPTISATPSDGYTFSEWTVNAWNIPASTTSASTTVTLTQNTQLTANATLNTYTITYNLNWWTETVVNPTTYTVESWAITLHQPTKVWYTFLWWTWSNGGTPQTWVTIPAWSYGNKMYNAVWQANTNTPYTIYHYVKRVWESTYELVETETWHWVTDSILELSWLAKQNEFVCATYDRWSLTWTEDGPWEVVTWAVIRWDGTTKIYLYYDRNYRRIVLSGDEHVDSLEWDGVRECGSERPINAIPKPWYHFVRWEERQRTEDEEEEGNGTWHSWWSN